MLRAMTMCAGSTSRGYDLGAREDWPKRPKTYSELFQFGGFHHCCCWGVARSETGDDGGAGGDDDDDEGTNCTVIGDGSRLVH